DLYDHWATLGILHQNDAGTNVTVEGEGFLTERGIDVTLLKKSTSVDLASTGASVEFILAVAWALQF
ncbi:MAG: hypothetical protein O7G13_16180, partial [Alphaproteobacteria bacterium]|nr:hypothetical protein [Alphaproteobacteria bacterium]